MLRDSGIRIALLVILVAIVCQSGCTTTSFVALREKPRNPLREYLKLNSSGRLKPSEETENYLARTRGSAVGDTGELLHYVRKQFTQDADPDSLQAAAELSYLAARQAQTDDTVLAGELYLDAAQYSWQYLTGVHDGRIKDPNAAEHRRTADVYNSSTESFARLLYQSRKSELSADDVILPLTQRRVHFEVPHPSPWIHTDQMGAVEFVSDYEVRNLRSRHVSRGIGVPIMIHRKRPDVAGALEEYYAEGVRFPATAVLNFPTPDEQRAGEPVRLQLYDPRDSDGIVFQNTLLPIETDLSTPLARFLTNPELDLLDTFAFLRPDKAEPLRGLYMVQPWDPDRIPVLMIHGLWSSPVTWMEMFNELQSDPVLRDHYQFWFYMYPTGEPVTFALADLRDELKQLREKCDPHGENEKLDQMVLVGHSMGGLLSYLMTVDSEDRLWNSVSGVPVQQLEANDTTKGEIQRVFFFESEPAVDRVVTIASPFRGSRYANRFTRWLGRTVVSLPRKTLQVTQLLTQLNNREAWESVFAPQTSLDSLAERSAVVQLIGQTSTPQDVEHHNILGVSRGWSQRWWTDGVVSFDSAHRKDVDSELTVRAGHSQVHRHPESIDEVRRVLKEHLRQTRRGRSVIPVKHQIGNRSQESGTHAVPNSRF